MICAVIADDLTGACDAAVQFAAAGLRTVVALDGPVDAEVVAYTTESRDVAPAEAVRRLQECTAGVRAEIVFKKIDSTLRGNTGAELAAFAQLTTVVNPAFPEMGRIVENGHLRVTSDPSFRPIHLPKWLLEHGAANCHSFDAVQQSDLVAKAAEYLDRPVLWAGSAGMASALAGLIGKGGPAEFPHCPGPVLFCIGSDHPVTVEQVRRLECERGPAGHVVRTIDRGSVEDLSALRPSALFLTGGDTASLICRSLGVRSIELRRELARGIPVGVLRGGPFDGIPVVTKSGGFGAPEDLIYVADYFLT